MPRDTGTGIYSTPAGTDGIPNRTISSTAYNLNVHDVETDLNTPRPIIAGGTGASDAATALKNLGAMPLHDIGQCYLSKASGTAVPLMLKPENGNLLWINGKIETIPDAGVTLGIDGQYRQYILLHLRLHEFRRDDAGIFAHGLRGAGRYQCQDQDRRPDPHAGRHCTRVYQQRDVVHSFTDVCSLFNPKDKTYISPNSERSTTSTTIDPICPQLESAVCHVLRIGRLFKVSAASISVNPAAVYLDAISDFSLRTFSLNLQACRCCSQPARPRSITED